ncbi:MAG: tRNA dimethylallyltransferase, partial [Deltaproteobacteria bacterium]
ATHPNNLVRVIRALEVYELTGHKISEFRGAHGFASTPYLILKIGLIKERRELYGDIEARVDKMMGDGLVDETKALLESGCGADSRPMRALGYKEITGYLGGRYSLEEAVELLKMNTRRYAKRQITWFKKEAGIRWFHPGQKNGIIDCVRGFLN